MSANYPKEIKDLCRSFFEAGIALAQGDEVTVSTQGFDTFWNLYDKKVGKPKCIKLWARLSQKDKEQCLAYIPYYVQAQPDKQYRKNPETFLRNKSWHDEIIRRVTTPSNEERRQQRLDEAARIIAGYAEESNGTH